MSLVIVKVNQESKTHSIYSEGISTCANGTTIKSQDTKKIYSLPLYGHTMLFGTVGDAMFSRYASIHLNHIMAKKKSLGKYFLLNKEEIYFDDKGHAWFELLEEAMIDVYKNLIELFKKERDENDKIPEFSHVISLNGHILLIEDYNQKIINCTYIHEDFCCTGQGEKEANALMMANIDIHRIFDIVRKIKTLVGCKTFEIHKNF